MNLFIIEYSIYLMATTTLLLTTVKVLKPSFENNYLNNISHFINFSPKLTINKLVDSFNVKNLKNDESVFALV